MFWKTFWTVPPQPKGRRLSHPRAPMRYRALQRKTASRPSDGKKKALMQSPKRRGSIGENVDLQSFWVAWTRPPPRRASTLFARWSCGFGRSAARVMAVHEAVHSAAMSTANFMG
eukprot:scaffold89885_cov66-Phaeocystis_antarctica.AAC.6